MTDPSREPDEARLAAWRAFLNAHAAVVRRIERDMAAAGALPLGWYDVLVALAETPGHRLRMHELADAVVLSRSGLTRLVDRLERQGLLRRERCQSDARGWFAEITPEGRRAFAAARRTHLDGVRRLFLSRFSRDELPDAQAVIVEGELALTPPEAGFSEDLARAWYILTAEAYVSHIMVVPAAAGPDDLATTTQAARALREAAEANRRAIRTRIVEATGLDRERLTTLYQATRWSLDAADRRALLLLLQLGNKLGEVGPYVSGLAFAGEA